MNSKTKFAGTNTLRMIKEFIDTQESPVTAYYVRTRLVLNRKVNLDALKFLSDYGLIKPIITKTTSGTVTKYFGINKVVGKKARQMAKSNELGIDLDKIEYYPHKDGDEDLIFKVDAENLSPEAKKYLKTEGDMSKLFGYSVVEDNSVTEIRLPIEIIDFLREPYVCGCEWEEEDDNNNRRRTN